MNISGKGGLAGQDIGSVSLIDSSIKNVPIGILTLGPEVYEDNSTAQLEAPCVFVLPPKPLGKPTTIDPGPYTTTLEVGFSAGGTFTATTTTVTIIIDRITTDDLPQSNVEVEASRSGGGFNPTPSVPIPKIVVTVTNGDGKPIPRTITFPPWPDHAMAYRDYYQGESSRPVAASHHRPR